MWTTRLALPLERSTQRHSVPHLCALSLHSRAIHRATVPGLRRSTRVLGLLQQQNFTLGWNPCRSIATTSDGPITTYMSMVAAHQVSNDRHQLKALHALQRLHEKLATYVPPEIQEFDHAVAQQSLTERTTRERLAADAEAAKRAAIDGTEFNAPTRQADLVFDSKIELSTDTTNINGVTVPLGVYVWGPVGCGKTRVMDIFFRGAPVKDNRKQRIHFHAFMRDVLSHYHKLHTKSTNTLRQRYDYDLLRPLAKAVAKQSYLLCFDEMQIPDVATAAVFVQLFKHLREYGVVVVATSNRTPSELYTGHYSGAFSDRWDAVVSEHWEVLELASPFDYRKLMLQDVNGGSDIAFDPSSPFADNFFVPLGPTAAAKMKMSWSFHTADAEVTSRSLTVAGRLLDVRQCTEAGAARFHFEELCARPLGPADYLAIATEFHTVFVDEIPAMTIQTRDQARRFISLVDALYECNTVLFCSAAQPADQVFVDVADTDAARYDIMHREMMGELYDEMDYKGKVFSGKLFTGEEELFASERCVSRLAEMRSYSYRTSGHNPNRGFASLDDEQLEFDGTPLEPHRQERDVDNEISRPRFGAKHFFGAGWFEKFVDRKGERL